MRLWAASQFQLLLHEIVTFFQLDCKLAVRGSERTKARSHIDRRIETAQLGQVRKRSLLADSGQKGGQLQIHAAGLSKNSSAKTKRRNAVGSAVSEQALAPPVARPSAFKLTCVGALLGRLAACIYVRR